MMIMMLMRLMNLVAIMMVVMGVVMIMMIAEAVGIASLDNGDRGILLPAPPNASELTRQKIKADKRDHCIADGFELVGPGIDLEPSGAKRVSLN